ncbi:MAG: cupin [Firmicutes bacterium]|nr:cupin [Bacillota bacterium]
MAWSVDEPELYNPDHLVVKHMFDSDHAAVVWFGFTTGQSLRDHETTSVAIIQVLKGRIRLNTLSEQVLTAGESVQLKESERHALTALEESLVQLLLVPHPRYHSLAKEIDLPARE